MPDADPKSDVPEHTWLYRRVALPILALLRVGASPERLAWSLALGIVVGINPVLGSTTLLCLLLAFLFRLNLAASQITNHLVYPLQLVLLLPFLRLGTRVFGTARTPLSPAQLLEQARTHPIALSSQLWSWEAHALIVWLVLATLATPTLALFLTPMLRRVQQGTRRNHPASPKPDTGPAMRS